MGRSDSITSAREQVLHHFRWIDGHADTWAMLADAESLSAVVRGLTELARPERPDVIVGIESRGFLLGPAVAVALGIGFVPVRKDGAAFPGDIIRQETAPDYRGNQRILSTRSDLIRPGHRVVLIDDWIETGSQSLAAAQLVAACGGDLAAIVVVVDEAYETARGLLPPIRSVVRARDLQ